LLAARRYGAEYGIVLQEVAVKEKIRWDLGIRLRSCCFTIHSEHGIVVADVDFPEYSVSMFEFYPTDGKSYMLPLWLAYPSYSSVTIGWRMGSGEQYRIRWHYWFAGLCEADQANYRHRFPAPEKGHWTDFYCGMNPGCP